MSPLKILSLSILFMLCEIKQSFYAQIPFDLLPSNIGINGQAQVWNLLCESDYFYTVGDYLDSSDINGTLLIFPFLAQYDFNGNCLFTKPIGDALTENPLRITHNNLLLKENGNILIYGSQNNSQGLTQPKIIELNPGNGEIINSFIINNPIDSLKGLTRNDFIIYKDTIVLSSYFWIGNKYNLFLTFLDTNFKVIKDFIITSDVRNNLVYSIFQENDSTLTLIGDSRLVSDHDNFPSIKPFISRVSYSGEVLYFKIIDGFSEKAVGFSLAYSNSVQKDDAGNWILSCVNIVEETSCQNCFYLIPYTFKLDADFNNIIWVRKFESLAPTNFSQPLITSLVKCSDNSGYITAGYDKHSFIYKVNNDGDSLWLRNYIPSNWDDQRALWTEFIDLKETPYNYYILGGRVSDGELKIIRPWLMQVDGEGCLIPGCNLVNLENEVNSSAYQDFVFYPNPSAGELYLLSNINSSVTYNLNLCTLDGKIIKSHKFIPTSNSQYIFSIKDITPGSYELVLLDNNNVQIKSQIINKI